MTTKLHAHDVDIDSLNMLQDWLSNPNQRKSVDSVYGSWEARFSGVPQGSILGPLLFNIFMCDLIVKTIYFKGEANDNTSFLLRENIIDVIKALGEIEENLVSWFSNDQIKLNTDKCHLVLYSEERFMVKPHTSDIRMTYEFIRVTYEWHTSAYEWHTSTYEWNTDDIRVHTSDMRMTYEYIRVTYKWHTITHEWHTDEIRVHTTEIRMIYEYI